MSNALRPVAEELARKTTRRGVFSRGADIVFGTLIGAAAGSLARPGGSEAASGTQCAFPRRACPCAGCQTSGLCAKPCIILTQYYSSGCWVAPGGYLCCDCDCDALDGGSWCGCGSDYHNKTAICP